MLSKLRFTIRKKINKQSDLVNMKFNNALSKTSFIEKIGFSWLRRFKIRQRLIVSFLVLSILPLMVVGYFSFNDASSSLKDSMSNSSKIIYSEVSKKIDEELKRYPELVQELLFRSHLQDEILTFSQKSEYEKMNFKRDATSIFVSLYSLKPEILNIELVSDYIDRSIKYGFVATERFSKDSDYYRCLEENKTVKTTNTWYDLEDGNLLLIIKVGSYKTDRLGAIAIIVNSDSLYEVYKDINLGEQVNTFVLNKDNMILASNNAEKLPKSSIYSEPEFAQSISEHYQKQMDLSGEKDPEYIMETRLDRGEHLVMYNPIKSKDGWFLVTTIPLSFINSAAEIIRNKIIAIGAICFGISLVISMLISISISKPLNGLVQAMRQAKKGDLTYLVVDSGKDEISDVIHNFTDMITNFKALIQQVSQSVSNVLTSASQIASSSQQSYTTSEQIALTLQEVAKGASEQAMEVSKSVDYMDKLSTGITKVIDDLGNVSSIITDTNSLSNQTKKTVNILNNKADETNSATEKIITDINSLNSDMKDITKIVKLIVGLADQTNLLSLNAAIEAARAGEAGRGFAVVAEEVKKLADQSKEASIMINNIINRINIKTQETVSKANLTSNILKEQMMAVTETESSFNTISGSMSNLSSHMEDMQKSVEVMIGLKENAVSSMENISAVSEEAAATSQEVSSSTEEQIASAEILTNLSSDLNTMAKELQTAISIFKVD